jgi:hypothetical protein
LLVVGNDTAVCMSTVALNHRRELCLTLRGAAENPILTPFQRWPHWRRVAIVRDRKKRAGCLAVTFITSTLNRWCAPCASAPSPVSVRTWST